MFFTGIFQIAVKISTHLKFKKRSSRHVKQMIEISPLAYIKQNKTYLTLTPILSQLIEPLMQILSKYTCHLTVNDYHNKIKTSFSRFD